MHIGKALEAIRRAYGISTKDFRELLGIHKDAYILIKDGNNPSKQAIEGYAKKLKLPHVELIYMFAAEEKDTPAQKLEAFKILMPPAKGLALQLLKENWNKK